MKHAWKTLVLKIEALCGFPIDMRDIHNHNLGHWATAIGRYWACPPDHPLNAAGRMEFFLWPMGPEMRRECQLHGWGAPYRRLAQPPVVVKVPMTSWR